ncbi:hypothetical protein HII31_05887 [Pseudocercospora fuligena]|uniref:alpha-galactosidase n=1 Tax=Pseudocercospora fuligena TaxID=685502 RepID=A0A8H6RL01_9PEZI|nr:hypothetical protein HII31_05887 [Pseudocercospora fuligena]
MRNFITAAAFIIAVDATNVSYWQPTAGTPWQIILSQNLPTQCPNGVKAIDGDLEANEASTWSSLKASGCKTICYFSAGSYENWRQDADQFNNSTDLGAPLDGWPGEWWLNTKSSNVRRIMQQRLDTAAKKGCDGVDPDNIDAYENDGGGLGLTQDDAIDYINFLSGEAHKRGLAMGLKNGGAIVSSVLNVTDYEVNEQCQDYDECDTVRPFINANKPVFGIEYTKKESTIPDQETIDKICDNDSAEGFSTLIKHMNLNDWKISCNITAAANSTSSSPAATQTADSGACVPHMAAGVLVLWFAGVFAFLM